MQLLDERDHGLAVLRADPQRVLGQLEVVADGALALQHRQVGVLCVLRRSLPARLVTAHQSSLFLVFEVELREFILEDTHPAVNHDLAQVH